MANITITNTAETNESQLAGAPLTKGEIAVTIGSMVGEIVSGRNNGKASDRAYYADSKTHLDP